MTTSSVFVYLQTYGGYRLLTGSQNKTVDEIQIWTCRLPALTYSSTRAPLSAPETTPAPSQLPPPHNSIPLPIPLPGVADAEALMTGRERRVRKSVNYAELKLNTCVPHALLCPRI
jgi:hypothetical protein